MKKPKNKRSENHKKNSKKEKIKLSMKTMLRTLSSKDKRTGNTSNINI